MRIVILSRKRSLYTTKRLARTARAMGHTVEVMDPLKCFLVMARHRNFVYYRGRRLRKAHVVLPRIGATITDYGLAVVHQFELMGIPVINSSQAIAISRDKLRSLQLLARADLGIPETVMVRDPNKLRQAIDLIGGTPVILKLIQGTQGIGVILADTYEAAESTVDALWSLGQEILLQRFISESRGRDIRALVLGSRVVAAMRRTARPGEFRSNIHRGGKGKALTLNSEQERVVLRAAELMGLQVAGVDFLEGDKGPLVMEVNSSPGFEGLEEATDTDIAREIIEYAVWYAEQKGA